MFFLFYHALSLNDSGKRGTGIVLNLNHLFRNAQNIADNIHLSILNSSNLQILGTKTLFIKYKMYTYCTATMDLH